MQCPKTCITGSCSIQKHTSEITYNIQTTPKRNIHHTCIVHKHTTCVSSQHTTHKSMQHTKTNIQKHATHKHAKTKQKNTTHKNIQQAKTNIQKHPTHKHMQKNIQHTYTYIIHKQTTHTDMQHGGGGVKCRINYPDYSRVIPRPQSCYGAT